MRSDGDAKKVIATATADHTKHGLEATIWRRDSSRMPLVDWLRVPVEVYSTYVGGGDPRKNGTPLPRVGRYLICKIIRYKTCDYKTRLIYKEFRVFFIYFILLFILL